MFTLVFGVGLSLLLPFANSSALGSSVSATGVAAPPAVSSSVVVVTTTADVANGDVSSVAALNASPGPDGISLREALTATDATGGSATVYIMFSAALNGATIEVLSELPPISRDHVVLEGIAPDGSPARVALDGREASASLMELLYVEASEVTVRWLRFTGADARRACCGRVTAVVVWPGTYLGGAGPHQPGPSLIANVQIVDDVFDNTGIPSLPNGPNDPQSKAVFVGTQGNGSNLHISGIAIARNTFTNYGDDAVGVLETDSGATADGVSIVDNTFNQDEIPIELGLGGTAPPAPRITGTQIIGNTIIGDAGIALDTGAVDGTIDQTLIEDNTIARAVLLDASAGAGSGDVISNTRVINNVVRANTTDDAGFYLEASESGTGAPSSISGVTIENDTVVNDQSGSLYLAIPNGPGASGNKITDVSVINSILYEPSGNHPIAQGPQGPQQVPSIAPDVVMNSLISGPDWAGTNGNINGDPDFVDEAGGDYHPTAGSPLINAGTTTGAPTDDFDGALRDTQPDIGAFEYGATPRPPLTVIAEQLGGSGTVTSTPAGIACDTGCSARFGSGASVTLTATPGSESAFGGWSGGGCSGTGSCTVTMSSDQTVTAKFVPATHTLTVSPAGSGSGSVAGTGISCPGACSSSYDSGTIVSLTATPAAGSVFGGWSGGGCSGTGSCVVTMSSDQNVTATFNARAVVRPPGTKITSSRINRAKHKATFTFKAIGKGSGFQCELKREHERASFTTCRSPKTYEHLKRGSYMFEVRAVAAGGVDPTPADKSFKIE